MTDTDTSTEARPYDEEFDTQLDVEQNPCGAWQAIQSLAAERDRYKARAERAEDACLNVTISLVEAVSLLEKVRVERLVEACLNVKSSLVAAVSLLEKGGRKAAWSDRIFEQMIVDYKRSINQARAVLAQIEKESTDE